MDDLWRKAGETVRAERDRVIGSRAKAAELGPSLSTWQKVESGQGARVSPSSRVKISRALGWTDQSLHDLGTRGVAPTPAKAEPNPRVMHIARSAAELPEHHYRLLEELIHWLGRVPVTG